MKRSLALALLFSIFYSAQSQTTSLKGIVNRYGAVQLVDYCNNSIEVPNAADFAVGEKVLLIQMKGVEIIQTNDFLYGSVVSQRKAGNYEIQKIRSINGNEIIFQYALMRSYDASESVQIVSLQQYGTASIDSAVTAKPWDGSSGGIVAIEADTLILNDSITVSGKGFRGAALLNDVQCFNNGIGGNTDYRCAAGADCGAIKGEGICGNGFAQGRGKNANGGGGGNDHNTGGGGGSNGGAGGIGGMRTNVSQFSCPGPGPGVGGAALAYADTTNKIFMGGGGGAGDENNSQGTAGANGGGLVFIKANVLVGNNNKILANGSSQVLLARSDGAGGGGAGGTVFLQVNQFANSLFIDAKGGAGGKTNNGNDPGFCFGPGGGGGGGAILFSSATAPANVTLDLVPGVNGVTTNNNGPAQCPVGTTNGALPGLSGTSYNNFSAPVASDSFVKLVAVMCCDTTVCRTSPVHFDVTATATYPPTYSWSTGSTTNSITPTVTQSQIFTVTVTDRAGCNIVLQSVANVVTISNLPIAICCDTTVCAGKPVQFNVITNPDSISNYSWNTGAATSGITEVVYQSETFTVTVTDNYGCTTSFSATATVETNSTLLATICCDTLVCAGNAASFSISTAPGNPSQFVWSTGSTDASISVNPNQSGTYYVTVTDYRGCTSSLAVNVTVPVVQTNITAYPDSAIYIGQSIGLLASGGNAYSYSWSPSSFLNVNNTDSVIASPRADARYCVTVTDIYNCTADACYNIEVTNPFIKVPDAFSPNGDGVNDEFTLFTDQFSLIQSVKIFNRWGEVVFEANNNAAWDGKYKGSFQNTGSYVISILYSSIYDLNKTSMLTKNFVLIR
jgi:gliding motility-associated-like protein